MANFGPGIKTSMHRMISLDFICIVEGELELELDSGEVRALKAGVNGPLFISWHRRHHSKPNKFF